MKGFESDGFKPDLQLEEQSQRYRKLDTVLLSEIPEHEGISASAAEEINEKLAKLEDLNTGDHKRKLSLRKSMLSSAIQNIAIREILSQKGGPQTLTSSDFEDVIYGQNKKRGEKYFNSKKWNGIVSTVKAIRTDMERDDYLAEKQAIFCDLLDASNAVDYMLVGRDTTKEGPFYEMKLVQVKTAEDDSDMEDDYEQHKKLGNRLLNEVHLGEAFDQKSTEVLSLLKEISEGIESKEIDLTQITDALLSKHFDISPNSDGFYDVNPGDLPMEERMRFREDFEKLVLLGQQYFYVEDLDKLDEFIDDFLEGEEDERPRKIANVVLEELSYEDFLMQIPVALKSQTRVRFRKRVDKTEEPQAIDINLLGMYSLNEDVLWNELKKQQNDKKRKPAA